MQLKNKHTLEELLYSHSGDVKSLAVAPAALAAEEEGPCPQHHLQHHTLAVLTQTAQALASLLPPLGDRVTRHQHHEQCRRERNMAPRGTWDDSLQSTQKTPPGTHRIL